MLKKIVLKNFMCHDNFEITLNPRVNFITGQNGSGKSAIVAALMVGFGQRATVTNRAQSVKDFIKRGRHSAVLEITLSNDGENSFEYEEYGDEITVIRKITESSSTYSLRDSQGKSHPCNAKVLNALLLHFSIQPNNPLCILSQDVARTFLQKFDPRSLYNLYTQATLSKTINESFADSQDTLKKTQLQLERKKKDIETLSQEVHDAEKRKQMAEKYRYLIERQEEVKNELVWSKIKALEDAAQKKETTQMEIDSERDKILHKIKNSSEDALKTKLKELQVELDQSQDKLGKLESQQHREKDALNNVKEELSILKQHFKEIEQQIQRKDREIKQLEEASNKVLNVNVPEIQKQKKELQSLMAKIQELEAAKRNSELHLTHLRDTYENSSLKLENLTSAMAPVKNQISDSRRKVDAFKKGKSLAIYGGWMPEFINEINNAFDRGRFFKKPKGPIGSYLQVIDSQWAPAIEEILKYQLSVFCLNSAADNKVFNEIAEKCIPRNKIPSTSTSKFLFSAYNYSTNEVRHPKYSSLIGQLKCSDPDILNCLIDEMSIEQILLVPDLTIACQMCEERGNAPTNLRYCVTKEADKIFPAPNYKFFASRKRSMVANFLQVNPAQHLTYLEKTIEESQETLYSLQNEKKMTEESNLSVKNDIVETQQTLGVLRQQLKHFNEKKSEVETTIFEPVSVDLYRKDIEMCLSEKEKALQKKEAIVNKITKAEILIDECIKNVKNVSEALRPIFEEKNKILHLIDCTEKDLRDKERLGTKLRAHFHSLTEKEKALREELQKIRKSIQEKTEKAQNAASEIEEVRDLPVVEEELKKVKDDLLGLKNFCEENTIEIAEQEFLDKKKLLVQSKRFMNRFEKLADMTSKKLDEDLKLININEQRQLSVAKALFSEVLKERDLQGTFNLDNHNQILKMHVVRGKEKATGKKGEISSLSGGEKSFTTIAFIIAVWESMTVPFFVMDEFDVFTDVITRNTILKMLSEYALQNSAQFIFLTPHDLSRIDTNRDDVAVHRINNPRA